ncbi:biotin--[acetyl-CoA-carboxylase] ligase [Zwartia vadi]|uniref:biotin--[acetyl-CoA-carboxylase] ligase n=1 Tax=Zwartia vadi TaxID=3058168 RepID=UPI0025B51A7E|nr:biotin--[acetyl-CoA-carboxylase] ligase [Zwartia vadi]MDN3987428.1 biotin--[acetyl-CoA-carboxylase] ligase [Zwartia vadi]
MRLSAPSQPNLDFPGPETFIEALKKSLPDFGSVEWVSHTGSTNADLSLRAKDRADAPPKPWLLGAHLQTAGKGRAGRPWANEAGGTLMFSCAFSHKIPLALLPGLAPAIGVSTCLALRSFIKQQCAGTMSKSALQDLLDHLRLKWPNDLLWRGAKLAGLLIETAPSSTIVIGMGINLRGAATLSAQLEREIADLSQVEQALQGRSLDDAPATLDPIKLVTPFALTSLVAIFAQAWQTALQTFATNGYEAFTHSFAIVDALTGQAVQVMDQGKILYQGPAQGTDSMGRLRVMTDAGEIPVLFGDVSIRPVHPFKGTP